MTTIINTKIGESKNVARLWLEGEKLARAGVQPGMKYSMHKSVGERVELRVVDDTYQGKTYNVSTRNRRGIATPLIEVRTDELREIFSSERIRVAIRQGRILVTANYIDVKKREREEALQNTLKEGRPLSVCSLFMGGGVLDRAMHSGLERSGLSSSLKVAVELEPVYLEAALRNSPQLWNEESLAVCGDIREMNWGNNAPQCSLFYAAVPCDGASLSGRSKNKLDCAEAHENSGALFVDVLDAVKAVNPAVILIENVPPYQNTASMIVIRSVLSSLGYRISEAILNGNDFGVLERRNRLVVVAVSEGLPDFDFTDVTPVREKEETLSEIWEAIPLDSERWKTYDYLAEKEQRDKAAGKGFMRQLLNGTEEYCGTIGKFYAKGRSTEPFKIHPEDERLSRLFTPVEHARVKGIPEDIIAGESDTIAHQILGQSVIYPKFEAVGLALGLYLKEWAATAVDSNVACLKKAA